MRLSSEFLHFTQETEKKSQYLSNSSTDRHKIFHDDAKRVSSAPPIKIHFNNPRWWTADTLERPILYHHEILQFVHFQDGGCPVILEF